MMPDVLLIDHCDFHDFPEGGELSFAKQMIKVFGNRLALVGISTDDTPVGSWTVRTIGGVPFHYYAYMHIKKDYSKPFLPRRLTDYLGLRQHRKAIMSKGVYNSLLIAHQTLLCVKNWGWHSICYCFPGMENPLQISRYSWAPLLALPFEKVFLNALTRVDVILAAADDAAIERFVAHSCNRIKRQQIIQFPTRVDTSIFFPADQIEARKNLGLPVDAIIIATSGRLHWAKGWNFLLECFSLTLKEVDQAYFLFIGDGEDRYKIESRTRELGLNHRVRITGHVKPEGVASHLNAADLFVMGSVAEGWPTAMVEAIAIGKPVVSTDVSGARFLIDEGKNGYVVGSRQPRKFCDAMMKALVIKSASTHSLQKARRFSLESLPKDLARIWAPLKEGIN